MTQSSDTEKKLVTKEDILNNHRSDNLHLLGMTKGAIAAVLSVMEEYAQAYHAQRLEEAGRELPSNNEIDKQAQQEYPTTTLDGTWIMGAKWMLDKALQILAKKDAEIEMLRNIIEEYKKKIP